MHSSPEITSPQGRNQIILALLFIAVGFYPLYVLLSTLSSPDLDVTIETWLGACPFIISGLLIAAFSVKEKGYQANSIRIFGIVVFFLGILLFFIPLVASFLLASGRGT